MEENKDIPYGVARLNLLVLEETAEGLYCGIRNIKKRERSDKKNRKRMLGQGRRKGNPKEQYTVLMLQ